MKRKVKVHKKGRGGCPLKQKLVFALWKDLTVHEIKLLLTSVTHVCDVQTSPMGLLEKKI